MWLVTGVSGQLGSVLSKHLAQAGEPAVGVASPSGPLPRSGDSVRVDITNAAALEELVTRSRPRWVIHAAAISSLAAAHADPERARRVNVAATQKLCDASARIGARVVYVSTDMVFDGESAPYDESSQPAPVTEYGRSKLEGERAALAAGGALVARLPLMYGMPALERSTTFVEQVRALRDRRPLRLFHDEYRTPLSLEHAAACLVSAARSDLTGTIHIRGPERLSRLDMGLLLAEALGVEDPVIERVSRLDAPSPEPRARDLSLASIRYPASGSTMASALRTMFEIETGNREQGTGNWK
jgi:dTDP-4-dehydrorhamnose reductase